MRCFGKLKNILLELIFLLGKKCALWRAALARSVFSFSPSFVLVPLAKLCCVLLLLLLLLFHTLLFPTWHSFPSSVRIYTVVPNAANALLFPQNENVRHVTFFAHKLSLYCDTFMKVFLWQIVLSASSFFEALSSLRRRFLCSKLFFPFQLQSVLRLSKTHTAVSLRLENRGGEILSFFLPRFKSKLAKNLLPSSSFLCQKSVCCMPERKLAWNSTVLAGSSPKVHLTRNSVLSWTIIALETYLNFLLFCGKSSSLVESRTEKTRKR